MSRWTQTPEEYEHVRNVVIEFPFYGRVRVRLNDGTSLDGVVAGTEISTDAAENLAAGRGGVVTSLLGEVRIRLDDGRVVPVCALDIHSYRKDPPPLGG